MSLAAFQSRITERRDVLANLPWAATAEVTKWIGIVPLTGIAKMNIKLRARFSELAEQAEAIKTTAHTKQDGFGTHQYVDDNLLLEWRVKVRNLLVKSCGESSEHMKQFIASESTHTTSFHIYHRCRAVFNAAKEDFEGGHLTSLEEMVQAEVFEHELDQARELLKRGYIAAAAVVAGVVLETTLRGLCLRHGKTMGSGDRMNADLAKAGVYNVLVQKQITAMCHVRNKAAHGETDQFSRADVESLIEGVERFLVSHIGS